MRNVAKWCALLYLALLYGTWFVSIPGVTSINRIVGLCLVLVWSLSAYIQRGVRKPHPFLIAFVAYLCWALMTCFWSKDQSEAAFTMYRYALLLGMCCICWDLFRSEKDADLATKTVVLAAFLPAINTIRNYLSGDLGSHDADRYSDGKFDPNVLAIILAIAIPIAWGQAISKQKQPVWFRALCYCYPFVAFIGIVLAASRGALVCAIPAVIYMAVTLTRVSAKWKIAFGVAGFVLLALLVRMDVSTQINRLATTVSSASTDKLSGRLAIWDAGWDVFSHNPFVGVGIGNFPAATASYEGLERRDGHALVAHNTFLSVATETGVIGIVLFFGLLAVVVRSMWRRPPVERTPWLIAFSVWAIGLNSISYDVQPHTWVLLMLMAVNASRVPQRAPSTAADRFAQPITPAPALPIGSPAGQPGSPNLT